MQTTRIWDLPTRLFHLLLIVCVAGLFASAELMEDNLQIHFYFGYATLTLLLFRLMWGFVGGRWSRFSNFVPTPHRLVTFVKDMRTHSAPSVGHNPLGALSVLAMLLVLLAQVFTGFFSYDDVAFNGPWYNLISNDLSDLLTEYHSEVGKSILLLLIALHVSSIVFYKRIKNEDSISPMFHGDKSVPNSTPASIDSPHSRLFAFVLLLLSAAITYGLISLGS